VKTHLAALAFAAFFAGTSAPVIAAPITYIVDTTHTYPRFAYSHFGFSTQQFQFNNTSGKIVYDAETQLGSVDITVDMKALDTGFELWNSRIHGEDYFDTARYPTATFKSTTVKFEGNKPVTVDGTLTLKGVTKPVTLTVTSFQRMPHPIVKKDALGANAHTTVKRSDFNMSKFVPAVSDEVTITLAVEAWQQ